MFGNATRADRPQTGHAAAEASTVDKGATVDNFDTL
jgi:hypothetical protein